METLLVSAFFDIGRGDSDIKNMSRSNEKYFEYFKFWSKIKNPLVIYTQPEFVDIILEIRGKRGGKTIIVPIDDISTIEPDLYKRMCMIEEQGEWANLRMHTRAMSNQAKYDYIMFLKYWCLYDAVKRLEFEGTVAWIDFGFNHGNECYIDTNDFDFYWNPVIDNYIYLYAKTNPDNRNSMLSLLIQCDCIMGCLLLLPSCKSKDLWEYCSIAMKGLVALDAIDDDQQLLLMAYRMHSEEFCIQYSDWFLPMKENGGEHLKVREGYGRKGTVSVYKSINRVVSKVWFLLKRDYSRPTPYNYGKRISKYARKYT